MKKIFRTTIFVVCMASCVLSGYAQIGYQISLLNTATGEPRANETVNVTVTLTNKEGGVIYTGNQTATTNDFGVLSLTIGDADTFKEVDFSKLPFFIEVSANGVMIGKSQVLSVPVAEASKRIVPIDKKLILGTWTFVSDSEYDVITWSYTFNADGTGTYYFRIIEKYDGSEYEYSECPFIYEIVGNNIFLMGGHAKERCQFLRYKDGRLYGNYIFKR